MDRYQCDVKALRAELRELRRDLQGLARDHDQLRKALQWLVHCAAEEPPSA